jgi:hypothetical protein
MDIYKDMAWKCLLCHIDVFVKILFLWFDGLTTNGMKSMISTDHRLP